MIRVITSHDFLGGNIDTMTSYQRKKMIVRNLIETKTQIFLKMLVE